MADLGPTFPLHRLVWANRHRELEAALHSRKVRPCRGSDPVGSSPSAPPPNLSTKVRNPLCSSLPLLCSAAES